MLPKRLSILLPIFILAACERGAAAPTDVLADARDSEAVARTVQCLEPVSDGTCNKKTCKKDAESDCEEFATGCIKSDHKYEGTKDEGTCTRVKINI